MKYLVRCLMAIYGFSLVSCSGIDEQIVELAGVYDAQVVGVTDYFTLSVSIDRGDNIIIDAPFDGEVWVLVEADIDDKDSKIKDIEIFEQSLGPFISIKGDGFYRDGVMQLDYEMNSDGRIERFRIIASK